MRLFFVLISNSLIMKQLTKDEAIKIIQKQCSENEITAYQIAKNTDLSIRGVQKILDGKSKNPRDYTLEMIFEYIQSHLEDNKVIEPKAVYSKSETGGVPYYNVDFAAGYESFLNSSLANYDFKIDYEPYNDADFWVNNIGNSMAPKIESGDIVALKEKKDINQIIYGEIYAVVLPEMRTIKYIRKSEKENHVKFVPENIKDFDEQDMPIELIDKFFLVLGSIKKFF